MTLKNLSHITTWVFDLDNTLYPPHMALFPQMEARMAQWICDHLGLSEGEAHALRKRYWRTHGTTLAGLIDNHGIEPFEFLNYVHDVDFSILQRDPTLARRIRSLPGEKIIYTNGDARYAAKVVSTRGLEGCFGAIYGIEHADFCPKPAARAFEKVFAQAGIIATTSAMFEDEVRNLVVPFDMGITTIHVAPKAEQHDHIDYHTSDLSAFLTFDDE